MPADSLESGAAARLRRAFARLVALERCARALEGLLLGAACAWVLLGVARLQGEAAARGALAPAALAGLFAAASWCLERWRSPSEIAARADRVLATPQLLETALAAPADTAPGWSELLARRALARFDRARLRLAAAPAWASCAALALLAAGAHEWLLRRAPAELAPAPLVRAWSELATGLEADAQPRAQPAAEERAQLARAVREAAAREARGELGAAEARALLERAAAEFASSTEAARSDPARSDPARAQAVPAALAQLGQAYGRPDPGSGSGAGALGGAETASAAGSGVPSTAAEGTMGGSAESGSGRLPAPPGPTAAGGEGALRPTLSARWWPRDQDGLVEAWIARQPRARRPR